ncbi:MAG: winged helix-turn-helix transcriptional regulator, partial [Candidatus Kapaibacterium sp.]
PRVEYRITAFGSTLLPIIESMHHWSMQHMPVERRST